MHFTPITLVFLSHLAIVMADSLENHGALAAVHSNIAAEEAQGASGHLDTFVNSNSLSKKDQATLLEKSARHLASASQQLEHAANRTRKAQELLNHNQPVIAGSGLHVVSGENAPLGDPETPTYHGTLAAYHAQKVATLTHDASDHLNTFVNSPSLSKKDRAAPLEHPTRLLNVAGQHLDHAAHHFDRANKSQELLNHERKTGVDPLYNATGADISVKKHIAEEYHTAWGKRHRQVAEELNAGCRVADKEIHNGLYPLEALRLGRKYQDARDANLRLAKHHESRALEAKAYQVRKREKKEKKRGSSSKGKNS